MTSLQIVQNRLKGDCGGCRTLPGRTVPLPPCPGWLVPTWPRGDGDGPLGRRRNKQPGTPGDFRGVLVQGPPVQWRNPMEHLGGSAGAPPPSTPRPRAARWGGIDAHGDVPAAGCTGCQYTGWATLRRGDDGDGVKHSHSLWPRWHPGDGWVAARSGVPVSSPWVQEGRRVAGATGAAGRLRMGDPWPGGVAPCWWAPGCLRARSGCPRAHGWPCPT